LTQHGKYELNSGSTVVQPEEYRVEENSIVERSTEESSIALPSVSNRSFFEGGNEYAQIRQELCENIHVEIVDRELSKFVLYWTETNSTGKKQRWQLQPTFDVKRRLRTWLDRASKDYQPRKGKGLIQ
jgi:hypothetical protein